MVLEVRIHLDGNEMNKRKQRVKQASDSSMMICRHNHDGFTAALAATTNSNILLFFDTCFALRFISLFSSPKPEYFSLGHNTHYHLKMNNERFIVIIFTKIR